MLTNYEKRCYRFIFYHFKLKIEKVKKHIFKFNMLVTTSHNSSAKQTYLVHSNISEGLVKQTPSANALSIKLSEIKNWNKEEIKGVSRKNDTFRAYHKSSRYWTFWRINLGILGFLTFSKSLEELIETRLFLFNLFIFHLGEQSLQTSPTFHHFKKFSNK